MVCMLDCLVCGSRLSGLHDGSAAAGRQGGAAAPWAMTGSYPRLSLQPACFYIFCLGFGLPSVCRQPALDVADVRAVLFEFQCSWIVDPSLDSSLKCAAGYQWVLVPVRADVWARWQLGKTGQSGQGNHGSFSACRKHKLAAAR